MGFRSISMKKINLLSRVLFVLLTSLSFIARAQNTVLSGQLKGLSDGNVTVFYNKDGVFITDTVTATNDRFTWKTNLKKPRRIALTVGNNYYYFFAEPGNHIKLRGVKDSTQSYLLSGSSMQQDADLFRAFMKDITKQRNALFSKKKDASIEERAEINKKRNNLKKESESRVVQFVADHPKSAFSIYLTGLEKDYKAKKRLYKELDESAKQTNEGKEIAQMLATLAKGQIGLQMTNFTQADTSGKLVEFNSFKGKYILVDFWASWCMPCRAENPNVLKAYNAFKDKGFTVIGISLDDNAANWKKAIRDDKLPWTQLSDLKGWKNEIAVSFGIQAIPSNFLIDPSGKIIAKDLRGEMLERKLEELLN